MNPCVWSKRVGYFRHQVFCVIPIPVEALYGRQADYEVTLRNVLQRKGYAVLKQAYTEGFDEGQIQGKQINSFSMLKLRHTCFQA